MPTTSLLAHPDLKTQRHLCYTEMHLKQNPRNLFVK